MQTAKLSFQQACIQMRENWRGRPTRDLVRDFVHLGTSGRGRVWKAMKQAVFHCVRKRLGQRAHIERHLERFAVGAGSSESKDPLCANWGNHPRTEAKASSAE